MIIILIVFKIAHPENLGLRPFLGVSTLQSYVIEKRYSYFLPATLARGVPWICCDLHLCFSNTWHCDWKISMYESPMSPIHMWPIRKRLTYGFSCSPSNEYEFRKLSRSSPWFSHINKNWDVYIYKAYNYWFCHESAIIKHWVTVIFYTFDFLIDFSSHSSPHDHSTSFVTNLSRSPLPAHCSGETHYSCSIAGGVMLRLELEHFQVITCFMCWKSCFVLTALCMFCSICLT